MKLPALALPRYTRAELLFSVKSFSGAMLAMYLANRAGLPRPFWALLTSYVVANPLAGAVRSKALFRFIGTLVGSTAAVLLVPTLSNAPELLTLALALWVGTCLFVSLLDRTPRAYVFMLSGYTAALIGFPSVQAPAQIFDTAVARVEEIGLAILCATLVHSLVWPVGLAPSLLGLLDRTQADARRWLRGVIAVDGSHPQVEPTVRAAERRQLAADITQLRLLSTHVPFDTTHLRWTAGALREMQDRVAALTPALSAVEDRLVALEQAEGVLAPDVVALLERTGRWIAAPDDAAAHEALRAALPHGPIDTSAATHLDPWGRALRIGLTASLIELIDEWQACATLRRDIDLGLTQAAPARGRSAGLSNRVLHRDLGMAALSASAAVISICLCSAFWIFTGWSSGAAATMMAAVFCSFFAAMDDPVPAIHGFLTFTLWSVPLSMVYVLLLMPLVHDFGMLVVICAPMFVLLGCYMARPATAAQALALVFGIAGTLSLIDTSSADIASFFNATLAQVVGIVVAARVTRLVRSVGADWSARRIQRAIWRELAELAANPRAQPGAYAVRMLDRIGLLAPRIAQGGAAADLAVANDALRDLRVGADIVALQRSRTEWPDASVGRVLGGVGQFFQRRSAGRAATLSSALLADIDASLAGTLLPPTPATRAVVSALVGLRRNLYPDAPIPLSGVPA